MVHYLPSKQRVRVRSPLSASHKNIKIMPQKLQFKDYRKIVSFISNPSFLGKLTRKQSLILERLHPKKGRGKKQKLSPFGQKLQSRRLFRILYGNISKKQYRALSQRAMNYPGNNGAHFLALTERRLDIIVYRMFFFKSLNSARQFIQHNGILVNETILNLPDYSVKPGDIIRIKDEFQFFQQSNSRLFSRKIKEKTLGKPTKLLRKERKNTRILFFKYPHFEMNYKILTGIFLYHPQYLYYPLKIKLEDITKIA